MNEARFLPSESATLPHNLAASLAPQVTNRPPGVCSIAGISFPSLPAAQLRFNILAPAELVSVLPPPILPPKAMATCSCQTPTLPTIPGPT